MKLNITDLSNQALGVARDAQNNKIFIPKSIIGDEIEAKIIKKNSKFTLAKIEKIITKSQFRKEPECQYFNDCGGCSLQHLEDDFYQNYKIKNIQKLLSKASISYLKDINFIAIGKNSRRKVKFHLDHNNNIGFFEQNSNNLVKIDHCLMLEGKISNFYDKLQQFLNNFDQNIIKSIEICSFDNVLDVIFELKIKKTTLKIEEKLILFAKKCQINLNLKISQDVTPLIQIEKPKLQLGNFLIDIPNNIFLQATKKALNAINNEILEFSRKVKAQNIADIYAGIGSYSFGIADDVQKIDAFEGVDKMTDSINQNAKKYNISHKLKAFKRDLFKDPVNEELQNYDLIIINPPRNGAGSQIDKISKLQKANLIMVSCDFNSFVRDLKILNLQNFQLQKLTLIDQFYYSHHIEIVAILKK